jgi:hypothetical protein
MIKFCCPRDETPCVVDGKKTEPDVSSRSRGSSSCLLLLPFPHVSFVRDFLVSLQSVTMELVALIGRFECVTVRSGATA